MVIFSVLDPHDEIAPITKTKKKAQRCLLIIKNKKALINKGRDFDHIVVFNYRLFWLRSKVAGRLIINSEACEDQIRISNQWKVIVVDRFPLSRRSIFVQ